MDVRLSAEQKALRDAAAARVANRLGPPSACAIPSCTGQGGLT
jgi:hypothetical protein